MNRAALAVAIAAAVGGIGAQSAQAAGGSTCSYNPSNHNLIITDHSGSNSLRIYRLTTGELRFDDGKSNIFGLPCPVPGGGTANVSNTDKIAVFSSAADAGSGGDSFIVDEINGPLGPGFTPESDGSSEIEVAFDTLGVRPYVQFNGTGQADRIEATERGGINFALDSAPYSDQDLDVTFTTPPALMTLHGGGGNDFVSGNGMDITGVPGPAKYPISLFGDADNDLLAGGSYADFLAGGPGDDRYVTSDDHGAGDWLTENAGEGSDSATVDTSDKVNGEIESRFVQFPVGRLKLAHAGMTAGRTAHVKLAWWHPKAWRTCARSRCACPRAAASSAASRCARAPGGCARAAP